MFLQSMFNQIDFLRRREHGIDLETVEKVLSGNLQATLEKTMLPQGLASAVMLSLCYAGFRHTHWINTPIFREILTHHIKSDFRIEKTAAAMLVDSVLREIRSTKKLIPSHVDNSDFEFLKYVFVIAATADNEVSLISDMGLGAEIILKMKSTLKMVMTDPADCEKKMPKVFLSELDSQIYEIMLDVSRDIRRYPWSILVDKLRYMMIGAEDPLSSLLSKFGVRWVFETLLAVGSKNIVTSNQIQSRLQKTLLSAGPGTTQSDIELILDQMHELNLIYPVESSRSNKKEFKWDLSNQAAALTADAFALTHLNAQKKPLNIFKELNPYYQKSLLEILGPTHVSDVESLVLNTRTMAPEVLKSVLIFLKKQKNPSDLSVFIQALRCNSESSWSSKAIDRALTATGLIDLNCGNIDISHAQNMQCVDKPMD